MDFNLYCDKVSGCYIGKSIGGSLGAPFEGMKQVLNVPFDYSVADKLLENDDLDLQVLFFEGVKAYGERVNSNILAKLFYEKYPICPGEYAYFKKNYERGINPPYSGSFNNDFYSEGMGCCIRGELWGCLFAANPALASYYAIFDGALDHSLESVIAEQFISSVIALCFAESDIKHIIATARDCLPESRFKRMVTDIVDWCAEENDYLVIREKIICRYGHPDCTNVFQNNGIIVMCLLKFFDNFIVMCEKAIACGFDTDCTAGICASVYGAVNGAAKFKELFGFDDVRLVLGIDCAYYGDSVKNFAREVAYYGCYFTRINGALVISDMPDIHYEFKDEPAFNLTEYTPVLSPSESRTVKIRVTNISFLTANEIVLDVPDGFEGEILSVHDDVITIRCLMKPCRRYKEKNLFKLCVRGFTYSFGFYAPQTLLVSQPYFENHYLIDLEKYRNKNYLNFFDSIKESDDAVRKYHLSYKIDPNTEYRNIKAISEGDYSGFSRMRNVGDRIEVSDLVQYRGPCVIYIVKELWCESARTVRMIFGASDYLEVYLNGKQLLQNEDASFFTFEKFHIPAVNLKQGKNIFAYKVVRRNKSAEYSAIITNEGKLMRFPKHLLGFEQEW